MTLSSRFDRFLANIRLTDDQKTKGAERREAVIQHLNAHYHNSASKTANSQYVGSWAKRTRIRPPRDVDVLFELPASVYHRFETRVGNKQSQLLQEVKQILLSKYTNTDIRGDGPVVIVPFTAYNVEIVPAFALQGGGHWVCMTHNGGQYKKADYKAEADSISTSNTANNGNTRDLVRMMKCWQGYCSVPIKAFHIELMAIEFLSGWEHRGKSKTYYDWMVRDFLSHLINKAGGFVFAPGTYEAMAVGTAWKSKAETAFIRAKKACEHEGNSQTMLAGGEWQKIFGNDFPMYD